MPAPVLAGGRVRRAYLHHDYAAEKRGAWERRGKRRDFLLADSNVMPSAHQRVID
jgi:hypothetical protein